MKTNKERQTQRRKNDMNNQPTIRKYLSIDDIQKEYLPISKKD